MIVLAFRVKTAGSFIFLVVFLASSSDSPFPASVSSEGLAVFAGDLSLLWRCVSHLSPARILAATSLIKFSVDGCDQTSPYFLHVFIGLTSGVALSLPMLLGVQSKAHLVTATREGKLSSLKIPFRYIIFPQRKWIIHQLNLQRCAKFLGKNLRFSLRFNHAAGCLYHQDTYLCFDLSSSPSAMEKNDPSYVKMFHGLQYISCPLI